MLSWSKIYTINPIGESIDLDNIATYSISCLEGDEISDAKMLMKTFDASETLTYKIPINDQNEPNYKLNNNFHSFIWIDQQIKFILFIHDSMYLNEIHWIISIISDILGYRAINKNNILEIRYRYLSHITEYVDEASDKSEFITTIPRVDYYSIINTKKYNGEEPILNIIISEDIQDIHDLIYEIRKYVSYLHREEHIDNQKIIQKIINLSLSYHDKMIDDPREMIIHKLQLLYMLTKIYIPRNANNSVVEYAEGIIKIAEENSMMETIWAVRLLLNWYFGIGEPVEVKTWGDSTVPNNLLLLPYLSSINSKLDINSSSEILLEYINLNENIDPRILLDGFEDLQENIGKYYLKQDDYAASEIYNNYAMQIYQFKKHQNAINRISQLIIKAIEKHYEELAIAANYFSNSGRINEAVSLAWSGLLNALRLVKTSYAYNSNIDNSLSIIIKYFEMCKRPLLKEISDMTEVIELKLNELKSFFKSLLNREIDEETAKMYIEMHIESLKFMVPNKPPVFMFMTSDGRLLYTREASVDNEQDTDTSYLLAGALTAIRSVLTEASMSQTGSVKEITLGDSVLLIEARKSVVVVASVLKIDDVLRKFTTFLADSIEEQWSDELWDWFGDSESIGPMIDFIESQIVEELMD